MSSLLPDALLHRAPELTIKLESNNDSVIIMDGETIASGVYGLAILEVFSRPTTFSGALEQLRVRTRGAQDWINLTSTIVMLHKAGVLQDTAQAKPTLSAKARTGGFDAAPIHIKMLNDRTRTSQYLKAIDEVVKPGDVVLDIGTGTGVLAVAAARAGARHVYAIEASGIGRSARTTFERNGLADKITLVEGWSTQVDLPEPADVLVSEIIGNEPLGEQVLEVTLDALKRLLKPQARLIPRRVRIFGLGLAVPHEALSERTFTEELLDQWRSWYGIDLYSLLEAARSSKQLFFVKPREVDHWQAVTDPMLLVDIELDRLEHAFVAKTTASSTAKAEDQLTGTLVYFELELSPTVRLSTHPAEAGEACSWRLPVWISPQPLSLLIGDRLQMSYEYRGMGTSSQLNVEPINP